VQLSLVAFECDHWITLPHGWAGMFLEVIGTGYSFSSRKGMSKKMYNCKKLQKEYTVMLESVYWLF
jgi:hypothetical protein